jgi:membrane protease YdiL (CAAX protease family)
MEPHQDLQVATVLFAILAIMLYGVILSRILPRRQHFPWNVAFAAGTVFIGYIAGLTLSELGLSFGIPARVLIIFIGSLLVGIAAVMVTPCIPFVRTLLRQLPWATESRREVWYAVLIRIPFSTGLLEEVLFRGVLLGLLLHIWNTVSALAVSSLLFGLWHISPEAGEFEGVRFPAPWIMRARRYIALSVTFVATTLTGVLLGGLRLWTGSVLAPWIVHTTINVSGVLMAARAGSRSTKQTTVGPVKLE